MHELNITPLLDLAFVLLVIFIITTTPLVQDKDLNLPTAASRPSVVGQGAERLILLTRHDPRSLPPWDLRRTALARPRLAMIRRDRAPGR